MNSGIYLLSFVMAMLPIGQKEITDDQSRFPISVNGKFGFINASGDVVIPAQFEATQEFSEGVCAVRQHGRYGFIDSIGKFVVAPVYDYATEFSEGLALVYIHGEPFFITHEGKRAFQSSFHRMTSFQNGRSFVRTTTSAWGIIDKTGLLVVDTLYKHIGTFVKGVAKVSLRRQKDNGKFAEDVTLIDSTGQLLFPFGKFEEIQPFNGGYTGVNIVQGKGKSRTSMSMFVNTQGEITYALPDDARIRSQISEGVAIVSISNTVAKRKNKSGDRVYRSHDKYEAYVTPDGKFIYNDKDIDEALPFSEGFAFCRAGGEKYRMINKRGMVVKQGLERVCTQGFRNGKALVKDEKGWAVIDTTGNVVSSRYFDDIFEKGIINDKYIFFIAQKTTENEKTVDEDAYSDSIYGLADISGAVIIPPSFEYFDIEGFRHGLLKTESGQLVSYFNEHGKLVWQQSKAAESDTHPMNIDYMNRGYFYANYNYTGHGVRPTRAEPKKITIRNSFPGAALSIIVDRDSRVDISVFKGLVVYVANSTGDTISFKAQDSRLYMKVQALDSNRCRDVEYLPSSWCGNSYHEVALPENHYWTFVMPVYEGCINTKLRVALRYIDPSVERKKDERWRFDESQQQVIYSNEFEGSINPGQLWRKQEYFAKGIMDPYND